MPEFIAKWRAGEMPKPGNATHTVTYDQTTTAYLLDETETLDGFTSWVAMLWAIDRAPQDLDEPDADYLERIDVDIREI